MAIHSRCLCALLVLSWVAVAGEAAVAPRLKVKGREILAPDGKPIRLRGFNVLWWAPPTPQDAADIQEVGGNCVRYMFGCNPTGAFKPKGLDLLDKQLRMFTSRGLWTIVTIHTFEKKENGKYKLPCNDPELQREFLDLWTYVITRYKDEPGIAAWEPLNEPHDVPAADVQKWYGEVIAHIRKLDPVTPIVVDGTGYANPKELKESFKLDDPNLIYTFHLYSPHDYTHQGGKPVEYPGKWGREFLAKEVASAARFGESCNVPIYCGEWGVLTKAPGYEKWLEDAGSVLEENAFHWTHWAWVVKPKEPINDTFDVNKQKKGIYDVMSKIFAKALGK